MGERSLDDELLRAVRAAPDSDLDRLARIVGLPRTNFGRPLGRRLRARADRLLADGLLDEREGRFRLSDRGRRVLAERALGAG